jgi:hypothetical protein
VVSNHHKLTSVALEEIGAAKVAYRVKEERETAMARARRRQAQSLSSTLLPPGRRMTGACPMKLDRIEFEDSSRAVWELGISSPRRTLTGVRLRRPVGADGLQNELN